jgi:hypothetical protein
VDSESPDSETPGFLPISFTGSVKVDFLPYIIEERRRGRRGERPERGKSKPQHLL